MTGPKDNVERTSSGMTDLITAGLPFKGMKNYIPPPLPRNPILRGLDTFFKVSERGSSLMGEFRAGCVLFMTSAYILFLNPLILSGGSASFATGMPANDVALATSIATGIGTVIMGVMGNYPWVVSVQLGTNTYFVNNVLQLGIPCGAHSTFKGTGTYANQPCQCTLGNNGTVVGINPPPDDPAWTQTDSVCQGTKIPFEMALACTFLEGLVFILICLLGIREYLLKLVPKAILLSGALGIGLFISFVGLRDTGIIVSAPYPTYTGLMTDWPIVNGGWGQPGYVSGVGFNSCVMYFDGPPYSVVCPWLAVGGLILTCLLVVWDIHGAFIIGIFFTTFISWIKFPGAIDAVAPAKVGLVPKHVFQVPKFTTTLGAIDFNWGSNAQALTGAFFLFLYLDFIGSCITFVAMGEMMGIVDEKGNIPRANMAFLSDGTASLVGGLMGSSALTTYVESASAVREGGRTGVTAIVCAVFFFLSCFLANLFGQINSIATGPILVIIGFLIFMSAIMDIEWTDVTEAMPAYATMIGMPVTNNIAYGIIAGLIVWVFVKVFSYKAHPTMRKWPGYNFYRKRELASKKGMFTPVPGFNVNIGPQGPIVPWEPLWYDWSLSTIARRYVFNTEPRTRPVYDAYVPADVEKPNLDLARKMTPDDSAHPR